MNCICSEMVQCLYPVYVSSYAGATEGPPTGVFGVLGLGVMGREKLLGTGLPGGGW